MGFFGLFKPNIKNMVRKKDVKGLIKVLEGKDYNLRKNAASALGELGDKRAVDPLVQALNEKGDLSAHAAEALGKIEDVRVIAPLVHALTMQSSELFRQKAFPALAYLARPREMSDRKTVLPIFHELMEQSRALLKELDDETKERKVNVCTKERKLQILYTIGIHAIGPLIQVIRDKNSSIKMIAASTLGRLGDKRAVDPLIQTLNDDNEGVRLSVIKALIELARTTKDRSAPLRAARARESYRLSLPGFKRQIRKGSIKRIKRSNKNGRYPSRRTSSSHPQR